MSVDLPVIVSIGGQSFKNCSSLTAVNCPKLASINKPNVAYPNDYTSFSGCSSLLSIRVDNDTLSSTENGYGTSDQLIMRTNEPRLEYAAPAIIHAKNDSVLAVEQRAFLKHLSLETADFNNVISVGQCAFAGCTSLNQINFPKVQKIDYSAFIDDAKLLTVDMPELTSIGSNAFAGCLKMHNAKF